MKSWVVCLFAMVLLFGARATSGAELTTFTNEQQAQRHCPTDNVVWLNLTNRRLPPKGERWYGRTKSGAFVCEKEADQAGDRSTRNGQ